MGTVWLGYSRRHGRIRTFTSCRPSWTQKAWIGLYSPPVVFSRNRKHFISKRQEVKCGLNRKLNHGYGVPTWRPSSPVKAAQCVCESAFLFLSLWEPISVENQRYEDIPVSWGHVGWSSLLQRAVWGFRLGFRVKVRVGFRLSLG